MVQWIQSWWVLSQRRIPWRSSKVGCCTKNQRCCAWSDRTRSLCNIPWDWGILGYYYDKTLHDNLAVKEICLRCISHNLTIALKQVRVKWSNKMLIKYYRGTATAGYNINKGDESWIYAYDPETKAAVDKELYGDQIQQRMIMEEPHQSKWSLVSSV